ncbi:MAG: FAD-dependent oxidoreductase [Bacteroidales bacterium]
MNPILIIGGGISGVTSAVELAEAGREVILLEQASHLGGNVVKCTTTSRSSVRPPVAWRLISDESATIPVSACSRKQK